MPKQYPYGVAMWITAAEVVGDAFFGIAIIADTNLLAAPHYQAVGYPFGPRSPPARFSAAASSGSSATPSACRSSPFS